MVDITLSINGRSYAANVHPGESLLELLRDRFELTGAKLACGEGECGACTVMVDGRTVNSCLVFAADCHGRDITTIEGLAGAQGLDPLQKAFVEEGAIQCGYCMPGMIMQAKSLVQRNPNISREQLRRGLEGNVCRCTGYHKVFDAVAAIVDITE